MKTNYVDLSYLRELTGGSEEVVKEMAKAFVEEIPHYMEGLASALANNNFQSITENAHKAKTSVKILGLSELSDQMALLESYTKQGINTEKYPEMIDNFIKTCQLALQELKEIIGD